jgi:hypothetical protein
VADTVSNHLCRPGLRCEKFGLSAFWLLLALTFFFADGGFAIVGPYATEV